MNNNFQVHGPFDCDKNTIDHKTQQKDFWKSVDDEVPFLSGAHGVYLLSLRNKSNYKPYHVGITQVQGFDREVFNYSNLTKILGTLAKTKGTLCVHLLARPKAVQKGFSVNVSKEVLRHLERLVLSYGRKKNPKMLNIAHTKFLDSVEIENVTANFTKGKAQKAVQSFRNAIRW